MQSSTDQVADVMIFKYFLQFFAEKMAFLTQNKGK
jgi:hypothetical protein